MNVNKMLCNIYIRTIDFEHMQFNFELLFLILFQIRMIDIFVQQILSMKCNFKLLFLILFQIRIISFFNKIIHLWNENQ